MFESIIGYSLFFVIYGVAAGLLTKQYLGKKQAHKLIKSKKQNIQR